MLEQASSVRGLRRRATPDGACYVCQSTPGFRDFLFPSAGACQKAKQIQQQQQLNSAGSFLPDCAPSGSSPSGCGTLRSQREGTHCTHAFCASSEHRHAHHLLGRTLTLCSVNSRPLSGLAADAIGATETTCPADSDMIVPRVTVS